MPDVPDSSQNENTYVLDAESGAETARLMSQAILINRVIGELLPKRSNSAPIERALDIACGPGGWVIDVAYEHPKTEVIGIDISQMTIDYARAQAKVRGLDNAKFKIMHALKPLDFPDNSFDMVNARLLAGFMSKENWPALMQECLRILRPGGVVCLTECELPVTNSSGFDTFNWMATQAFHRAKRIFSPDGRLLGITPMLARFLRDAGYEHIQEVSHFVNFSAGTEAHSLVFQDYMVAYKLLQPFLIKMEIASQAEIDALYDLMLAEMYSDDFCAVWFYLSAWGEKPQKSSLYNHPWDWWVASSFSRP